MDAKLPVDIFENVTGLAIEGCKAVANYIREVRTLVCLHLPSSPFLLKLTEIFLSMVCLITMSTNINAVPFLVSDNFIILSINCFVWQVLLENTKQLEYRRGL